jgi:co-chaperonin GroES (HSP10)
MPEILITKESKVSVNPKFSQLSWLLVGDRALMKYHAPLEFIPGTNEKNPLFMPKGSKDDHTQEDFAKGELVAIGPGHDSYPNPKYYDVDGNLKDVEVGMTVNYWHQQAIKVEIDKEEYHLIRNSDIWGVV